MVSHRPTTLRHLLRSSPTKCDTPTSPQRGTHSLVGVRELVCLDMPLGDAFVASFSRAWDNGDAVFPLDQRLPEPARRSMVEAMKPTVIVTTDGHTRVQGRPVEAGDALVVATSGSSGEPKGVVLTRDAVAASAAAVGRRLGIVPADVWFACLPPAHIGGLSVITRSVLTGNRVITAPGFTPAAFSDAAAAGATLVSLVPTAVGRIDTSLYRTVVVGGSRPPGGLPANCVTTYGMTETGSGVVYDRMPLEGVEVAIRGGIIHVRCPMLMRTYRNAPHPDMPEGWFRTGDMGEIDSDGRLTVHGREGDLIITGGENVWPEPVEAVISSHPAVTECCVVGIPDPEWGSAVHAFVVTRTSVSLDEVRDHVKATLPAHCAPKHLHVVHEIPRTALGKPRRSALATSVTGPSA